MQDGQIPPTPLYQQALFAQPQQHHLFYQTLIENFPEGVMLLSDQGLILYQNEAATSITGWAAKETMRKPVQDFIDENDVNPMTEFFGQVAATPNLPFHKTYRIRHKAGYPVWVDGTLTNLFHTYPVHALLAVFKNCTRGQEQDQQRSHYSPHPEHELKEKTLALEQKVKDRTTELEAFTYSVSHDLRTPVRVIYGMSQLLMNKYHEELQHSGEDLVEQIFHEAERMNQLIDDLLKLSRLGSVKPEMEKTDMHQLAAVTLAEVRASQPGHTAVTLHPMPPAWCAPGLVRQVWSNLFANAFKYSAKTENPRVEAGALTCGNKTIYYVKDNGAGFDMQYAGKLFQVFQRLHSRSEFEGTGVGLSVVKRIMDKHGGKVWAESAPGKGATFYFKFPEQA